MGQIIYIGWYHRETLAHCNTVNGHPLCERVVNAFVSTGGGRPDRNQYLKTRKEVLERGWKLCPRCDSKKNQSLIEEADRAIEDFRKQLEGMGL
jgi:hypothetical protein